MGRSIKYLIAFAFSACLGVSSGALFAGARATTEWLPVQGGRLKAEVFASPQASAAPVLVIVLHGDAPHNQPDYQYTFAARAADRGDVMTAAILRPGYTDPSGDASSGQRGNPAGGNYTPDRLDMIATAIRALKAQHQAREVVLVGHSGGAALAADLLALYPDLAHKAVLASCPCDLEPWRQRMKTVSPTPLWDVPTQSVSPLAVADRIPRGDQVVMLVGSSDNNTPEQFSRIYVDALTRNGVSARVVVLPGRGHEILLESEIYRELQGLIGR